MTIDKLPKPASRVPEISAREAWRVFGIMAEFVDATERLANVRPAVTVFGSARVAPGSHYYRLAEDVSRRLSDAGFAVISGGGTGVMEASNKGAFAGPSPAIGLNIDLPREQTASTFQDISLRFKHFFTRKVMFAKFATAFIILPGGFGTLDELFEALTLVQTGKTRKMPIILMHAPFWGGLRDWVRDRLIGEAMIDPGDAELLQVIDEPQAVVEAIFAYYERRGFEPSPQEREVLLNL